jgi:anaerobic magnesium-protoporphyrin IX monomethyl ester cyclase
MFGSLQIVDELLLLNPPSKTYRYSRDYFCSKVLKGRYIEQPIDLVILSGILSAADIRYSVFDATVSNMSVATACKQIQSRKPRAVLFLSGTVSWTDDKAFMLLLKRLMPEVVMIGIGDVFFNPYVFEQNLWIDAVLYDFTSQDIVYFIKKEYEKITTMLMRGKEQVVESSEQSCRNREFNIPIPRHKEFLRYHYTFPFVRHLPFVTVLTDFGCPFHCRFCIYDKLMHKVRSLENVYAELAYIKELKIKEIFFKDQTFGASRARAKALLDEMIHRKWDFGWTAFTRVDCVDEKLLQHMKKAGCHTLIFGVESWDQEKLACYNKKYDPVILKDLFVRCKKIGIETVGTFMIGFPGETNHDIDDTVQFAIDLDPDYAAFNIFVDKEAVINACESNAYAAMVKDQSGICMPPAKKNESSLDINAARRAALRKFYLRPAYLREKIFCPTPLVKLKAIFTNAFFYLR